MKPEEARALFVKWMTEFKPGESMVDGLAARLCELLVPVGQVDALSVTWTKDPAGWVPREEGQTRTVFVVGPQR